MPQGLTFSGANGWPSTAWAGPGVAAGPAIAHLVVRLVSSSFPTSIKSVGVFFISMAAELLTLTCDAVVVVDQSFVPPEGEVRLDTQVGVAPFFAGAQTFTPLLSGQLEGFDFWIQAAGGAPLTADLLLRVETTTAQGVPSGISLGSVMLPASFLSQQSGVYKHIAMDGQNISLVGGERYAAVFEAVPFISGGNSAYDFRGYSASQLGCNFAYDGGQGIYSEDGKTWKVYAAADFDYVFRVYMDVSVPPPATLNYQVSCGNLVLSWSQGVLQSSSQVNGTYTDISSATFSYSIPLAASGSQHFYRLRIP